MPIPGAATTEMEITDVCEQCNSINHDTAGCNPKVLKQTLPDWEGFKFNPHWTELGFSQIDQERLAIGRWADYIPYRDPNRHDRLPAGTKLTRHLLDEMIAKKAICMEKTQSILLDLYGKGVISLQEIAIIAGERGLHVVPFQGTTLQLLRRAQYSALSREYEEGSV